MRSAILFAAALHVLGIVGLLAVTTRPRPAPTYITLMPPDVPNTREVKPRERRDREESPPPVPREHQELPPFPGAQPDAPGPEAERPRVPDSLRERPPVAAAPLADQPQPSESPQPAQPLRPEVHELPPLGPAVGDGRIWVSPRPALPAEVADALYGGTQRDSVVVRRLRSMIDSLNKVLDEAQRQEQVPTWTRDVAGKKFGIDSQFIHVAGIKIPTAALALLPIRLPQGNYGEMARSRQLEEMREDLLRSAQRTETLHDFRRYVKELRERKDAEREAARRAREQQPKDTIEAVP